MGLGAPIAVGLVVVAVAPAATTSARTGTYSDAAHGVTVTVAQHRLVSVVVSCRGKSWLTPPRLAIKRDGRFSYSGVGYTRKGSNSVTRTKVTIVISGAVHRGGVIVGSIKVPGCRSGYAAKPAAPSVAPPLTTIPNPVAQLVSAPGPATQLLLSGLDGSTAGTVQTLTVTAEDAQGRAATGYSGTIHFTSNDGAAMLPADYTFTSGDAGVHTFSSGVTLRTAGTQTVTAADTASPSLAGSDGVSVSPGPATHLAISGLADATAGAAQAVTVATNDAFGNVAAGYRGTIHFNSSDGAATLPADYTFTSDDAGRHTFPGGVTLRTAGTRSVSAADVTDASLSDTQSAAVGTGPTAQLKVGGLADTHTPGETQTLTVTATDASGNLTAGYTGTAHFNSSDDAASLPSDYTFTADDAGTHTFTGGVMLKHPGSQSVTATDTGTSSINGSQTVSVGNTLYVAPTGANTNLGSQAEPLKTIGAAVTKAASFTPALNVDAASGTYSEGAGVALASGVAITGGFSSSDWTASTNVTKIIGSPQAALADNVTGASLANVTLAPSTPLAARSSVYGLREINGAGVELTSVTIVTPAATGAANGTPGANGVQGGGGYPGSTGDQYCTQGPGFGGGGASAGGSGGPGGCGQAGGDAGSPGGSANGGGSSGTPGSGGVSAVNNGTGGTGGPGGAGTAGDPGSGATNGVALANTLWVGQSGAPGHDGTGGGGGGGGGGGVGSASQSCQFFDCVTTEYSAGSGGGGGGGGSGGHGGGGGPAGGGSFGVYLSGSSVTLDHATITAGQGGAGGAGGHGGTGAPGGSGGNGGGNGSGGQYGAAGGGNGGSGGGGGDGGAGGGGAGGPSIGVFEAGSGSSVTGLATATITVGHGGPGGGSATSAATGQTGLAEPTNSVQISTVAGVDGASCSAAPCGDGGDATSGLLNGPNGVAVDQAGDMAIADSVDDVVRFVPAAGGTYFGQAMTAGHIYTVAGQERTACSAAPCGDGGAAAAATLDAVSGVGFDANGNLVIADSNDHAIRFVPVTSGTYFGQAMTAADIYTVAGQARAACSAAPCGDGGAATAATLDSPDNVRLDGGGDLVIADSDDHAIRFVPVTSGTYFGQAMTADDIYTVAGQERTACSAAPCGDGGPATSASFGEPSSATVDAAGDLLVADQNDASVRFVPAASGTYFGRSMTSGNVYAIAGQELSKCSTAPCGDGGSATSAKLNLPWDAIFGAAGSVLIADYGTLTVRKVAGDGAISTLAGTAFTACTTGACGDGSDAIHAKFGNNGPGDLALSGSNVLVTDTGADAIRSLALPQG